MIVVEVSNDLGCISASTINIECASKKKTVLNELTIENRSTTKRVEDAMLSPNPARNEINASLSNETEIIITGQILNSNGQLIKELEVQDKNTLIDIINTLLV